VLVKSRETGRDGKVGQEKVDRMDKSVKFGHFTEIKIQNVPNSGGS